MENKNAIHSGEMLAAGWVPKVVPDDSWASAAPAAGPLWTLHVAIQCSPRVTALLLWRADENNGTASQQHCSYPGTCEQHGNAQKGALKILGMWIISAVTRKAVPARAAACFVPPYCMLAIHFCFITKHIYMHGTSLGSTTTEAVVPYIAPEIAYRAKVRRGRPATCTACNLRVSAKPRGCGSLGTSSPGAVWLGTTLCKTHEDAGSGGWGRM
eukprot:scaffold17327_cov21-Tisochrysis_lutea.AAC.4